MHQDPEVEKARLEIAAVARAMLGGTLSFIEGARRLHSLRFAGGLDDDLDFDPFTSIYSSIDALPIGAERVHWAEDALERLQPEIVKGEQWAREFGQPYCQLLIDRFGR